MSHAITALDLLRMDGYEVIEESTTNLDCSSTPNEQSYMGQNRDNSPLDDYLILAQ